jgi:hypothetical protein
VKMPSPLLKMRERSSGGNVSVPNQSQKKEGRGVVGIGGNGSSGDMQLAREERDEVEEDIYSQLRRESPHRTAKTVALARIHEENKDEKIEEERDSEEERSVQLKDPPELYYDAVHLANAFKKKGNLGTHFNWKDLGIQVGLCFNSLPPNVNFLNGPLQCVHLTENDEKEENEVVRGLDREFIDFDILDEGNIDSEKDNVSDYLDDVIIYEGSGSEESLNDCVEENVVVREEKKRERTVSEGGRKKTASIERTDEKKRVRKAKKPTTTLK